MYKKKFNDMQRATITVTMQQNNPERKSLFQSYEGLITQSATKADILFKPSL
jgi:hypothetical protein